MTNRIAGPGINLPIDSALYPDAVSGGARTFGCYTFELPAGGAVLVPPGDWIISNTAGVSSIEWFDGNITGQWIPYNPDTTDLGNTQGIGERIYSDGVNFRVANLSGSAYGGLVTAAGSGYVQATTTITAGAGNSTWVPIIGGALARTLVSGGANYSKAPLIVIPTPQVNPAAATPTYGIGAYGVATISAGAVNAVTLTFAGAGYTVAPTCFVIPDPFDPNIALITPAVVTLALTHAGQLTGVVMLNFGTEQGSAPTLTVNGAGTSATCTTNPAVFVAAATDIITMQRC
ncbi:MAG TPA: hypothetical protein VGR84_18985 [Candidatus Acidoferrales bacterium]|nr:hypothetical protein [Candidatus Acidoferrales bacterium]